MGKVLILESASKIKTILKIVPNGWTIVATIGHLNNLPKKSLGIDINNNFKDISNLAIVSPDVGGVVRARAFAKRLNTNLVIIDKRRDRAGESEVMNVIGEVENKTCILLDDIADSAGTLSNAAKALKDEGAKEIFSYIVHGVLSERAFERISNSEIKELVLTDSIQATEKIKSSKKIRHISIAPLIGEAIKRIDSDSSVSALFD